MWLRLTGSDCGLAASWFDFAHHEAVTGCPPLKPGSNLMVSEVEPGDRLQQVPVCAARPRPSTSLRMRALSVLAFVEPAQPHVELIEPYGERGSTSLTMRVEPCDGLQASVSAVAPLIGQRLEDGLDATAPFGVIALQQSLRRAQPAFGDLVEFRQEARLVIAGR